MKNELPAPIKRASKLGLCLLTGLLALVNTAPAANPTPPAVGEKAPLFEGKDQDGKTWKLADHVGQKVVLLYFYPKDDTPGCTKQACALRDRMDSLKQDGVEVAGVSMDSAESHRKFIAKHALNFTLLADPEGKLTGLYGAKMSGREMARRVSYLIALDGRIRHVTDHSDAGVHLEEMKQALAKLKTAKPAS